MENPTYHVQVRYAVECVKQLLPQVDAATCLVLVGDFTIVHASHRASMTVQKRPSAYRFTYR